MKYWTDGTNPLTVKTAWERTSGQTGSDRMGYVWHAWCFSLAMHYALGTVILPMDSVLRFPYGEWWSNQMMIAGLHTTTTKWFGSLTHPLVFRDEGICADRTLRGRSQSVVGSASPGSSQDAGMLYGVRSTYWQTKRSIIYFVSVLCASYPVQSIRSVPWPRPDGTLVRIKEYQVSGG